MSCYYFPKAFSKSHRTFKLKERVMLLHAWITDTIFDDQKLPSCGMLTFLYRNDPMLVLFIDV